MQWEQPELRLSGSLNTKEKIMCAKDRADETAVFTNRGTEDGW